MNSIQVHGDVCDVVANAKGTHVWRSVGQLELTPANLTVYMCLGCVFA